MNGYFKEIKMIEYIDVNEITVRLDYKQVVNTELGSVLGDIEAQLNPGHPYKDNDRITWSHEGTHGINARIKNELCGPTQEGIYLGFKKAATLFSPGIKLANVAKAVPNELRGDIYKLYLVDQQRYWNDRPLYVFNEWSAYYAGAKYRLEHNIKERGETCRYMMEAMMYSVVCIKASEFPLNLRRFFVWLAADTINLYRESEHLTDYNQSYWNKAKEHEIWNELVNERYVEQLWYDYYILGLTITF